MYFSRICFVIRAQIIFKDLNSLFLLLAFNKQISQAIIHFSRISFVIHV